MGPAYSKQTTVQANDSQGAQRIDSRMVQNILLIWLDDKIDQTNIDCQNVIAHLRQVINTVHIFTNGDECIQFLEKSQYDKVCMIISGSLGKEIMPRVHDMAQIHSISIFCGNMQSNEQWAQGWSKVTGVYTDTQLICDALKQSMKYCEQNTIGFSLMRIDDLSKNLNRLDPIFIIMCILKDVLFDIPFDPQHLLSCTEYFRKILEKDNQNELANIDIFQQDYEKKTPIWWYSWESFLYPTLNQALCSPDVSVIMKMVFFIRDLYRQIDNTHREHFTGTNADQQSTVYRGQAMSKAEFEKILKTKGGLISINNFLLTSTTETAPMKYVERVLLNPEKVGVLFVIKIKSNQSTAPSVVTDQDRRDQILFAMNALFRIKRIRQVRRNTRLFRVKLEMISENDNVLQMLKKRIREETFANLQGWKRLAAVLLQLKRPREGEQVYDALLKEETEESKKGWLYNGLGWCKYEQGDYEVAIGLYRKSIEIYEKYFPNDPNFAMVVNNIGLVYDAMGEYTRALLYYEKALTIKQQSLPPNHPDLEILYNDISSVYEEIGDYTKALSYREKIVQIKQQILP